jgi:hypothetical protein
MFPSHYPFLTGSPSTCLFFRLALSQFPRLRARTERSSVLARRALSAAPLCRNHRRLPPDSVGY